MEIDSYGIMRGGIHIIHSWIISKFDDDSVLYYNNIKNPLDIEDRLITKKDTRIQSIKDKLTTNLDDYKLILKSFESKSFDFNVNVNQSHKNILVIRNPYNNLASSIAYIENNGKCSDIKCDDTFINMWKDYVKEALDKTNYLSNKIVIVYDLWITNKTYRGQSSSIRH